MLLDVHSLLDSIEHRHTLLETRTLLPVYLCMALPSYIWESWLAQGSSADDSLQTLAQFRCEQPEGDTNQVTTIRSQQGADD